MDPINKVFVDFCQLFGLLWIIVFGVVFAIRSVVFLWNKCTKRGVKWGGGPHTWAVITGATDGIGLEYARQLADKGYNLFLLSRNPTKLDKVRQEITSRHEKCEVKVMAVDFTRSDIYDNIANELKSLEEIDVLVNNVGIVYPQERPEYFTKIPDLQRFITDIVNVNVIACTRLTALVLPAMEQRGRGIVINLSSATALSPAPLLAIYSATKVYIDYFSRALNQEYKHKGLVIQSVLPFYVSTNMSHNMDTNFLVPNSRRYVREALKTVGKVDRTSGYPIHRFFNYLNFWSYFWSKMIGIDISINFISFRLRNIRRRIYKKLEEKGTGEECAALEVV